MNPRTVAMYAAGVMIGLILAYILLLYGQSNIFASIGAAVGVVVIGILYEVIKKRKGRGGKHVKADHSKEEEKKEVHEDKKEEHKEAEKKEEKKEDHNKKEENKDHSITSEPLY